MSSAAVTSSERGSLASAEDVRRVAGPLNDGVVAEILRIGASLGELEIAARYLRGEGDIADRAGHPLSGRVARVYEILSAAEEAEDEAR